MIRRLLVVLLIFSLIVGTLVWAINRRGDTPEQEREVRQTQLTDYANTSTEVRFILRSQINAKEDHRVLQITVGRNYRTATIFEGYNGVVLQSLKLDNTQEAYLQFLAALDNEGYTKTRIADAGVTPDGACSGGRRGDFEIFQGAEIKQSLWTTSCSNMTGTYGGNAHNTRTLFERQIPNYNEFVQSANL